MERIPKVTEADLKRIVNREYSEEKRNDVLRELSRYANCENEGVRVKLAILKLSKGDLLKVSEYVDTAIKDYRDVLFWAEYSSFIEIGFDTDGMKKKEIKWLQEKDWNDY